MSDGGRTFRALGGQALAFEGKGVRLFGSIANPITGAGYIEPSRVVGRWSPRDSATCGESGVEYASCGAWMLESTIIMIMRSVQEGTVTPLPNIDFGAGVALPAGAVRIRNRGLIRLRVNAELAATEREFEIDSAQSLEINASCVCAGYLVPDNFVDTTEHPTATAAGLVVDVWAWVGLSRLEAPVSDNTAILTTCLAVPAEAAGIVTIPPFATDVTIYQTSAGAASGAWSMFYGDPSVLTALEVGTIPWLAGARKTVEGIELPNATHLQTDIDLVNDRFFTMRWTIRP